MHEWTTLNFINGISQYYSTDNNDRVTRKNSDKKSFDVFQNNSHTAHKYWPYRGSNVDSHRRTSWCANRIPPPTRQHACKTSTTDTRYVRGSERQNWPQYTDVNNSNNKRRLCREPSTITISTTFRLFLHQFLPSANLQSRMKNGHTSVLLSPYARRTNPVSPPST